MIRIVIALVLLTTPAEACHRFSAWFYPWPQPCAAARWAPRAAFRVVPAVVDPTASSASDVAVLRAAMIADAQKKVWP